MEPAELLNTPHLLVSPRSTTLLPSPKMLFSLLLPLVQFPSLLKLTKQSSKDTPVVFLTPDNVEQASITPSPQSDTVFKTELPTTSSETHGVHHGETKVTSTSLPLVRENQESAVSKSIQSGQTPPEKLFELISISSQ
jgi:hypothetical protein